jgi:serine/threonine-protein kinase
MIPGLLKLLEDDWWLASTAASALTRLKAAEALPLLLRLLYQYDRRWVALTHLPAFRDPRIEPEIVKCLSDPRRHIRVATLKSLGQIGARASVAVIQHYLEDPEEMVRIETENTLRILLQSDMSLSKSEQHHLIQEACGPDKTRRARAIEQLRQMATRQHLDLVGPLMSLIQQDDITIRTRAIKFLEDWHESATIFQFLDTLRDLNRDLIDKAIDAISQTRGQLMQATINDIIWQKLENLAQPPSPYLHRFAVEIATNIKLKSALPPLRQLTNSSDWDIREIAIAAVGKIGGKEAITTLAELLDRPETRWPAIHALGVYGKSEALPLLLPWLENSDIRIQLSTLEAIGKIQDRQAIPAIRQMQRQAHPLVKQTAKQILEILENL